MCTVCDEFGNIGCPACGFHGSEQEVEYDEITCTDCDGEGYFYFYQITDKYISKREYYNLNIYLRKYIEIEECTECKGTGEIRIEIRI
jgi:RecJ-like exonuclease